VKYLPYLLYDVYGNYTLIRRLVTELRYITLIVHAVYYNVFSSRILTKESVMPVHFSEEAAHFIKSLLEKDPARRIGGRNGSAETVKGHRFFEVSSFPYLLLYRPNNV
jgi:hypothetical protein